MSGDEDVNTLDLFQEPEGYFAPSKEPTVVTHHLMSGQYLTLRLVGHNPLWGHFLWNAGRTLADYLENNQQSLIVSKTILELGAGAGLPSLVCALLGAKSVVVTDYPDQELIENLQHNIDHCSLLPNPSNIRAKGYRWGSSTDELLQGTDSSDAHFDVLILGDLLFNHSEHQKLLSTVQQTLKRDRSAQALVFFTPYRPWLLDKDLAFFDLARAGGFVVRKFFEKTLETVMFENDPGDEKLRRTVFGYSLHWADL